MGNEGQQPPLPEQRPAGQQGYYGWQYDQGAPGNVQQQSPVTPPSSPPPDPYMPTPPSSPPLPPSPSRQLQQPQWRPQYQEPIPDMGTSLGYGQGLEYQYFDTPQPSQPIPQLRQERLQQLREERLRRQQRRLRSDITSYIPTKQPPPPSQEQWRTGHAQGPLVLPPPSGDIVRTGAPPPPARGQTGPRPAIAGVQPAVAPVQDTAMIQRVRVGKASLILTGAFIVSRFLGVLRSSVFAFVFGTSAISDAYLQAFLIPDTIFNIIAGGALSSAFIPVFTKYMVGEKDDKTGWHIASSALNISVAMMTIIAMLAIIFAQPLVALLNPGVEPRDLELIVALTRIMLIQSIVLGAGVVITGILNTQQDYRSPALGTVLYNVGLLLGLVPGVVFAFLGQRNDVFAVYAATIGVVIGAILQVGIQVPSLIKIGIRYAPTFDIFHPGIIQIARQMGPRVLNASMLSVSTVVDRVLILMLGVWIISTQLADQKGVDGLITQYNQSFMLFMLPLGIFGMSIATAVFPTMAENVARNRLDRVRGLLLETLRSILFMSIPASIALIVLGFPIIQALLQHGRFGLEAARSMTIPLACFAVGLAGHASVEILTRVFYALRDSKTPVVVSIAQFVFKIALSLVLVNLAVFGPAWGMGALALSTSIAGLLEAFVLFWLLYQRLGDLQLGTLGLFLGRVLLAALLMGAGMFVVSFVLDFVLALFALAPALAVLDTTSVPALGVPGTIVVFIKLLIAAFVGIFIYIRCARMLGIEELGPVKRVLDRLKLSWI